MADDCLPPSCLPALRTIVLRRHFISQVPQLRHSDDLHRIEAMGVAHCAVLSRARHVQQQYEGLIDLGREHLQVTASNQHVPGVVRVPPEAIKCERFASLNTLAFHPFATPSSRALRPPRLMSGHGRLQSQHAHPRLRKATLPSPSIPTRSHLRRSCNRAPRRRDIAGPICCMQCKSPWCNESLAPTQSGRL
ncbi:hypothetical protein BDY17DRAFT_100836 [Neohortaea acidophila]|uniref:Uncharacterized protein n=1 Tax=Neohortaea acidophila TaxID=245834 RepID=A0A6A6PZ86_9PEZI|nr:uncharacterized protein BDY17DRAFT_100836 [Neohortaea acidophila]KAF2485322.1 hypothetical protein BDY17DRAFT_100836 [Neohortaea acidophila]